MSGHISPEGVIDIINKERYKKNIKKYKDTNSKRIKNKYIKNIYKISDHL